MLTKAEQTKQFILETASPIFNKNGYAATSIADITNATNLTKGAIYGNFKNKEELAISAFKFNVKKVLQRIENHINRSDSPIEKLFLIVDFYRTYYDYTKELGGCPIINVGVDANNQNTRLLMKVRDVISIIQNEVATIVKNGIKAGEIKPEINPIKFAKELDSMIQGAIFMVYTMNDDYYLKETINRLEHIIETELRI